MKQIERLISLNSSPELGDTYFFGERHRMKVQPFLTLEMAQEARRKHDQKKKHWSWIGNGYNKTPTFIPGEKTKILQDKETGLYYAQLKVETDILVSDLYPKSKIGRIKKFLIKNSWAVNALNTLKNGGFEGAKKYYGILPTREGYTIVDFNKHEYGKYKKLEQAVFERDRLLKRGVIL